ncbi:hypothetical protein V8C42DRAFT_331243 [Trichoderma barbatum]
MVAENLAQDGPTIKTWLKTNVVPCLYTWYGAALLVFIVFNFRGLPLGWMTRTCCPFKTTCRGQRRHPVAPHVGDGNNIGLPGNENAPDMMEQHPLFQPIVINTDTHQLEIDMNVYKSNSTFFSDLEVSRLKLMGQIMAPAWPMDDMEIEYKGRDGKDKKEKVEGRPAVILGATHTSFKHELRPHAAYTIESRVLGWDSRWIYVGSWFHDKSSSKKTVQATSLSKYIIKKGRITVRPEQFFLECGWIPAVQNTRIRTEEEMTSIEKVLLWSEFQALNDKGMNIVQTWREAIMLMDQDYED